MAAGKNVLMLGPLGNYLGYMESFIHLWDYDYISKIAKTIRGLDINRVLVDVARADGYTGIEFGSAENFSFDQDFDLILAPDLIEHLGRPLDCLECCSRALRPGGLIVMETPNPIGIDTLLSALIAGDRRCLPEHTCWIDAYNAAELARRANLIMTVEAYTPINAYSALMRMRTHLFGLLREFDQNWGLNLYFGLGEIASDLRIA